MKRLKVNKKITILILMVIVLLCSVQTASYADIVSVTPGDDDTSLIVKFNFSYREDGSGYYSESFDFSWRQKSPQGEWESATKGYSVSWSRYYIPFRTVTATREYTIEGLILDTTYEVRLNLGSIHEGTTNFIPLLISSTSSLTEATLDESMVKLTLLYDDTYEADVSMISNVELDYDNTDFDDDTALIFSVDAGAIAGYTGDAFTAEISVSADRNADILTMFWVDYGTDKIQRANLDGSNIEDLVTQGIIDPHGIALDVEGGKMYWADSVTHKIQRANLDGSNVEDLVTQGLRSPSGIALDVVGGKMYWTDSNTDKIQRANLDGSNVEDLVTQGLSGPYGIALDVASGKMYWTDWYTKKIQRANFDGSNVEDLVTQGLEDSK